MCCIHRYELTWEMVEGLTAKVCKLYYFITTDTYFGTLSTFPYTILLFLVVS